MLNRTRLPIVVDVTKQTLVPCGVESGVLRRDAGTIETPVDAGLIDAEPDEPAPSEPTRISITLEPAELIELGRVESREASVLAEEAEWCGMAVVRLPDTSSVTVRWRWDEALVEDGGTDEGANLLECRKPGTQGVVSMERVASKSEEITKWAVTVGGAVSHPLLLIGGWLEKLPGTNGAEE